MKLDARLRNGMEFAASDARQAEELGFEGAWSNENSSDAFLPLGLAAAATRRIELGPSVAIAFSRSPMTVAYLAHDLQRFSEGRFVLGLCSQIKPHIEKRFSMPWSSPAARMREFVLAMRHIWSCWNEGTKLEFRGDFYKHTLMSPFFNPGTNPYGPPKVMLAGVGELMTEVAGETCDGFLAHSFTTERYLTEITLPALERGMAKSGRARADFQISMPVFVVTGRDDREIEAAKAGTKQQIAFYGSTPAYRGVLELHGWGDLQTELNAMSKQGKWVEMGQALDDEVLEVFAVVAEPDKIAAVLLDRFGKKVDRLSFYAPYAVESGLLEGVLGQLKSA